MDYPVGYTKKLIVLKSHVHWHNTPMRKRQPITPEKVYQSLKPITSEQARANSGFILRPFENTFYVPAISRAISDDEAYLIERNEDIFTNEDTLRGTERRMHLLGTVITRTQVVPEQLPRKAEEFLSVMLNNEMAKIAVANVSITSMYPIRIKAEHATTVRIAVDSDTPAREAAAQGVAAFLNGQELLDADAVADFDERLRAAREMAQADKRQTWESLEDYRKNSRRKRF